MISFKKGISIGLVTIMTSSGLAYVTLSLMTPFNNRDILTFITLFNVMLGLAGLLVLDIKKKVVA